MQGNASTAASGSSTGALLLLLFGGVLLGALDIAIVGPALPALQEQFGIDSRSAAAIFSIYILFGLISTPLLASLSDRYGRRRIYILCLLLFGIGSIVVASAGSYVVLLLGRALQATGAGGMLPVASAVIADRFPAERRGRALGLIGAVFGLAFMIGPLIGWLFLQWSWRWLFLINLPLIAVLVVASARMLEDHARAEARGFDMPGTILLAIILVALAIGASTLQLSSSGWPYPGSTALASFAVAAVAAAFFWRAETRAAMPVVHPGLMQSRRMQIIGLLALATGLVEASMVFLPTLAVSALDVTASRASFMLIPLVLALIAGSVVAGRSLDRVGPRPVIQAGMGFTIAGLLLFAFLPLSAGGFYAAGITVGFGLASLLGAPLRYVALEEGGHENRGASQGLLTVCLSTGRLFGASLTGGIAAAAAVAVSGYRQAMLVFAIACALALLASGGLRRRQSVE